ncbi:oxygen-dependent protoporphyrinogen oxidase [Homoserinimonas aerilata]|uniref:Oxygen-dependent protoporphyrinogen oxidase n=1 Tax=Homoserinimonas aerilata TaxID=1162970 RepID=A0A542YIZ8_9MICO|nr:FAD-dependent oxidoreductase [Homoserinimonas aerilata]TQL48070.1 oxygen-dependent protoporphyrinogen oxidase [Homoserinimonas aerilata]
MSDAQEVPENDEADAPAQPSAEVDVVIVGGGIAGLVAARELVVGGLSVTLVEASDRLGGKVAKHSLDGLVLDAGAESFSTRRGTVADYATKLGLGDDVVAPNASGAWLQPVNGPALPLPKAGLLGIPSIPLAADVIDVVGLAGALRAQLDSLLPGVYGSKEQTLGGLVRKRMGRAVLERLVAPVAMGVHSRHPDELVADVVAPGLRSRLKQEESLASAVRAMRAAAPAGSLVAGIRGGIARLVDVLTGDLERFGVEVRLGTRVTELDASGVTLDDDSRISARHVVLAAPDDGLTGRAGNPSATPAPIVLATLVLRSEALDAEPRGTGVLVAPGSTTVTAKALTHATRKWSWLAEKAGEHRHVLRLSYDGSRLGDGDDAALRRTAIADAQALLGVPIAAADVLDFDRVEWRAPSPDERPAPEGVSVIGESVAGTGLAAVIAHSRAESAQIITLLSAPPADF